MAKKKQTKKTKAPAKKVRAQTPAKRKADVSEDLRRKNILVLAILLIVIALFFALTMVRIGGA